MFKLQTDVYPTHIHAGGNIRCNHSYSKLHERRRQQTPKSATISGRWKLETQFHQYVMDGQQVTDSIKINHDAFFTFRSNNTYSGEGMITYKGGTYEFANNELKLSETPATTFKISLLTETQLHIHNETGINGPTPGKWHNHYVRVGN